MINNIIEKKECLGTINSNNKEKNIKYIHPLINTFKEEQFNKEQCYILPQIIDNRIQLVNQPKTDEKLILNSNVLSDSSISETNTTINPLSYFCLPINSNNYIEIVFGISNINKLSQWINMIDDTDIELLDFVMGLFWKNYYNIIDEDMDSFIGVNRKIIKKFMYKDIDNNIIVKIVNRLIKNNYGKKIKYINKIKKYLTKYI
jgi:hypothetical protein